MKGDPGTSAKPDERTAKLIVIKHVDDSQVSGVTDTASDFTMHVNGNNPSPFDFPGSESGSSVSIALGPYAVTETKPMLLSPNKRISYRLKISSKLQDKIIVT